MLNEMLKILRPEKLPSNAGSNDYFTGRVKVTPLVQGEEPSCITCACVMFDTNARSAWHTHPKGQLLIVIEGLGLVQEWGQKAKCIRKGDVIWTPPNVKHWHGASDAANLTHIAIQETLNGKNVEWFEKVSDEQYQAAIACK